MWLQKNKGAWVCPKNGNMNTVSNKIMLYDKIVSVYNRESF